jgi:hypothetical protein
MKTNYQTVDMIFRKSKVVYQLKTEVPVLSAAKDGTLDFYFYDNFVVMVDANGTCCGLDIKTMNTMKWCIRPSLNDVITMDVSKDNGYFFQFHKDCSITCSYNGNNYYWGPVEETNETKYYLEGKETEILRDCNRDYIYTPDDLYTRYDMFWDDYREAMFSKPKMNYKDPKMVADKINALTNWKNALEDRLKNNPGVYENENNRKGHEMSIETATFELERIQKLVESLE